MVVRAQERAGGREAVCARVAADMMQAEEGFARSYSAQFEEVYRRNPVGQRAVRLVAGMLGGADDRRRRAARSRWSRPTGCSKASRRTCCCTAMPMCS